MPSSDIKNKYLSNEKNLKEDEDQAFDKSV